MPASASRASLMDDLAFVGELEKFDAEPPAHASVAAQGSSPDPLLDALLDVWEPRATFYEPASEAATAGAHASRPAPRQQVHARQPQREEAPQPETDYAQALVVEERHVVRSVAGFLLMMALGGAAAVLVFHERAAQLLR